MNKNFEKILNAGKNSWKIVPVLGFIGYIAKGDRKDVEKGISLRIRTYKGALYLAWGIIFNFCSAITIFGSWTPNQFINENKKVKEKTEYVSRINQAYQEILSAISTKKDSIDFYKVNGLEKYIQLNEIPFNDKERIIKENKK